MAELSRSAHAQLWLAAALLRAILLGVGASCRLRVVGERHARDLIAEHRPVILSFWHNRVFSCGYYLLRHLFRKGVPITMLNSQSRDGELVSKLTRMLGVPTVRGSASRGGTQALRQLYRAVVREGSSPVIIPDGPTGPVYRVKPGALALAQVSGAPILPMACAADRYWRIGSWDRLIVPKPFARVALALGAPIPIPRELSDDELERHRILVQETLDALVRQATEALA